MLRFFFDLAVDGTLSADDTGVELPSDEAAEQEAMRALTEMGAQLNGAAHATNMALLVRDESGARVCTVALTLSVTRGGD